MGFRIKTGDNTNFNTPQEMYADYKRRKINGPLDYQSEMIDSYITKAFTKKDVALELPTGSGKTLIGLLIGEFRRRKNKEKVVYLCPTNQLVYQTAQQAKDKYGIKVHAFTGKLSNYDPSAKSDFNTGQVIAITNYSSFFINRTFFEDVDIIIMDDAHSAENYIASLWTVEINRYDNKELYLSLVENLKGSLEITQYNRMINDFPMEDELEWFDKLPNIKMQDKLETIIPIIDAYVKDNKLKYPWANIRYHLHACNLFISWNQILIRPFIPPTLMHLPFSNAKQRIYMSATLGESGELERITGISNIYRLPIAHGWDKKGIGRRFFIFPGASFLSDKNTEVLLKILDTVNKSLILVQDDKTVRKIADFIEDNCQTSLFFAKDIESSKDNFLSSSKGVIILANRFDGIDLADDECRMLIVINLPNATHLQEKFLTTRMAASVLFNERIRTRIVQAIGRCTRSHVDYAAVCIFGEAITNTLVSPKKITEYHPELQAELEFGYEQSTDHENVESLIKMLKLFFKRGEEWEEAEEAIINLRDQKIKNLENKPKNENYVRLFDSAKYEVQCQYALWKEDYEEALENIEKILACLDGNELLKGYRGFWNYIGGYVSYKLYTQGKPAYYNISKRFMKQASSCSKSITWFNKLVEEQKQIYEVNTYVSDIIERIEKQIVKDGIKSNRQFEERVKNILNLLNDQDGLKFEQGHKDLGVILGYISDNASGDAEPDPWWIINDDICIVSEDKIYEDDKPIPPKHVRQADSHKKWIKEKITTLNPNAIIETIMITNTDKIQKGATVYAKDIWYVNKEVFLDWARKGIEGIRKLRSSFIEEGNLEWRIEAEKILSEMKVTPKDFLEFIKSRKLNELSPV